MAYQKNTWASGDVVTSAKLNNIENGIAGGGASRNLGIIVVPMGVPLSILIIISMSFIGDMTSLSTGLWNLSGLIDRVRTIWKRIAVIMVYLMTVTTPQLSSSA